MRSSIRGGRCLVGVVVAWLACASPLAGATFIVNSGSDEIGLSPGNGRCETAPGNGVCTLRRAMIETQAMLPPLGAPGPDVEVTIVLAAPGGTITLTPGIPAMSLVGRGTVSIVGAGQAETVIDASGTRLFFFSVDVTRVSALTIRNALHPALGFGASSWEYVTVEDSAGGIYWGNGALTLVGCDVRNNGGSGVTIGAFGPTRSQLRVTNSTIRGNQSTDGGGLRLYSVSAILEGVTLESNRASGNGGAIHMSSTASLTAVNATLSGNTAGNAGGALFVSNADPGSPGTASLTNVTVTGNQADADANGFGSGGGIAVVAPGEIVLNRSIVAGNRRTVFSGGAWAPTPGECDGPVHVSGPTLFGVVDCAISGVAPLVGPAGLGPLQDNGGPTRTHLPQMGSAAIDSGGAGPCLDGGGAAIERDQRGLTRPSGAACDLGAVEVGGSVVPKASRYDLDGDGRSDLVWRNTRLGQNAAWLMSGATISAAAFLTPVEDPGWDIVGSDDFDGDGRADLLWRHAGSGRNALWLMDGLTLREPVFLPAVASGAELRVAGTGDLDGDGRADIVWREVSPRTGRSTGTHAVWLLDGGAIKASRTLTPVPGWSLAGVADANGDGKSDLLWRHDTAGSVALWLMSGTTISAAGTLPSVSEPGWTIAVFADLSGDDRADIVWRNVSEFGPGAGQTAAWLLDGLSIVDAGFLPTVPGGHWTLVQALDGDGDGRSDLIWRGVDGRNARWQMDGLTLQAGEYLTAVPHADWTIR